MGRFPQERSNILSLPRFLLNSGSQVTNILSQDKVAPCNVGHPYRFPYAGPINAYVNVNGADGSTIS